MAAASRKRTRRVEHTLPAVHTLHLVELCEKLGVRASTLLADVGLDRARLADPAAHVPLSTMGQLLRRARARTGEPGLGILLGLQMRISSHGWLGFAAMSAPTVRDALEIAARFTPTQTSALAMRLHEGQHTAALVIEPRTSLGYAEDTLILSLIVGIWQIGSALTGRTLQGSADVTFAEPPYFARFRHMADVRFGQPVNQLVFARDVLALPLVMADPAGSRLALAECERALARLGGGADTTAHTRRIVARPAGGGFRTLEEAARTLGVSTRTLKRRLAAEQTTYRALVDEARREQAILLLRDRTRSLEDVATQLGYSDAANFSRAYRRWTGKPPRA